MSRLIYSLGAAWLLASSGIAQAIESLAFKVVDSQQNVEIRQYAEHMLATVRVSAEFGEAGSQAFRPLFNYISGENAGEEKIAMTAPVLQQLDTQSDQWLVSFVMPSEFDDTSLPVPSSDIVSVSMQPSLLMAALQYRGGWSQSRYEEHEQKLMKTLGDLQLSACGEPRWARHDPPFMPWFMRKNEILIPLCETSSNG